MELNHDESGTPNSEKTNTESQKRQPLVVRLINAAAWLAFAGTLGACFASWSWMADILVQFRVQYVLMTLPALILFISTQRWKMTTLFVFILAINCWSLIPYFVPNEKLLNSTPASQPQFFRLLSLNVLRTNSDTERIIEFIKTESADFVFLMETHSEWETAFEELNSVYPYAKIVPRSDYMGVAFFSKHPWQHAEVIYTGTIQVPSIEIQFDAIGLENSRLYLIATHPIPPFGPSLTEQRDQQLLDFAESLDQDAANMIVGDLNLTPWSPRFQQVLKTGNLSDASIGYGLTPTLTFAPTWLGGLKVDHVLVSKKICVDEFQVGPDVGSDHRPIRINFCFAD